MVNNKRGETNPGIVIFLVVFAVFFSAPILMMLSTFGIQLSGEVILGILVAAVVIWLISVYNGLVKCGEKVKQASGGIDVYLKQRFDLIPNIVETVKGYAKYEESVITEITKLRTEYDHREKGNMLQNQELNERYTNLLSLVEAYPDLKANESFLNLQKVLTKVESQLQAARRIYNVEVTEYNTKRLKFPNSIVASLFRFEEAQLFEATEVERQKVNIDV